MVVGNGLIASKFADYLADEDKIIFASGVSNSKNINQQHFLRETELLKNVIGLYKDKTLIYFSTCSIDDEDLSQTPYVQHKLKIEQFIKQHAGNYYLFRVSNVAGFSNNPYTILNYFVFKILSDQTFVLWKHAYRNIIDIDDMYRITDKIIREGKLMNQTINIANSENYSVLFIVKMIETHLKKKAYYNEVEKGNNFRISISLTEPLINELKIKFDENYLARLLNKYYHSK